MSSATVNLVSRIEPEDRVRADFYALFARLYFAAPDAELLRMMGTAPLIDPEPECRSRASGNPAALTQFIDPNRSGPGNDSHWVPASAGTTLPAAWTRLSAAARVMDVDAAADEYNALFGGIGHSEISLFCSNYVGENAPGASTSFLVDLRAELAALGLSLQTGQNMPEDHVSALFETMRLLIQGNDVLAPQDIESQSRFFRRFIAPWQSRCCSAIAESNLANFYKRVAECTGAFLTVEFQSFEIA